MRDQPRLQPGQRVRVVLRGSRYYGREGTYAGSEKAEGRKWYAVLFVTNMVCFLRDDLEPVERRSA